MRVLSIGLSVYDITVMMNEEIVIDQKHRVDDAYECIGGQASNAACVCAKWGIETYMLSRIGDDNRGKAILDTYHQIGMKVDCVKVLPHYATCSSIIINHQDQGKRTILNRQDKNEEVVFPMPDQIDFILFDAHEEKASLQALEKFPTALKMLDAERVSDLSSKLFKHMDYIVGSKEFAKEITGLEVVCDHYEEILMKIKASNDNKVVITLGRKGLIYEEDGLVKHMEAFPVKVVDTTGAGDIFHGALIYAICHTMEWEDSLRFASLASALSVQKKGGFLSIPDLKQMIEAWEKYKKTGTI